MSSVPVVDRLGAVLDYIVEHGSASVFIETGTFRGRVARKASALFDRVYTIELSDELYSESRESLSDLANVTCIRGDSSKMLPQVIRRIHADVSIAFYLDAHFFVRGLTKQEIKKQLVPEYSPFPLYDELSAIGSRNTLQTDVLVVDDLHLWGKRTKKQPHVNWKTLNVHQIKRALHPRLLSTPVKLHNRFLASVHPRGN
jgi:hypothetical protein